MKNYLVLGSLVTKLEDSNHARQTKLNSKNYGKENHMKLDGISMEPNSQTNENNLRYSSVDVLSTQQHDGKSSDSMDLSISALAAKNSNDLRNIKMNSKFNP